MSAFDPIDWLARFEAAMMAIPCPRRKAGALFWQTDTPLNKAFTYNNYRK